MTNGEAMGNTVKGYTLGLPSAYIMWLMLVPEQAAVLEAWVRALIDAPAVASPLAMLWRVMWAHMSFPTGFLFLACWVTAGSTLGIFFNWADRKVKGKR